MLWILIIIIIIIDYYYIFFYSRALRASSIINLTTAKNVPTGLNSQGLSFKSFCSSQPTIYIINHHSYLYYYNYWLFNLFFMHTDIHRPGLMTKMNQPPTLSGWCHFVVPFFLSLPLLMLLCGNRGLPFLGLLYLIMARPSSVREGGREGGRDEDKRTDK